PGNKLGAGIPTGAVIGARAAGVSPQRAFEEHLVAPKNLAQKQSAVLAMPVHRIFAEHPDTGIGILDPVLFDGEREPLLLLGHRLEVRLRKRISFHSVMPRTRFAKWVTTLRWGYRRWAMPCGIFHRANLDQLRPACHRL